MRVKLNLSLSCPILAKVYFIVTSFGLYRWGGSVPLLKQGCYTQHNMLPLSLGLEICQAVKSFSPILFYTDFMLFLQTVAEKTCG